MFARCGPVNNPRQMNADPAVPSDPGYLILCSMAVVGSR